MVRIARNERRERGSAGSAGQASVSLVATVPLILLLGLVLAQVALIGYGGWSAGHAARAAARAALVGDSMQAAAEGALPGGLFRGVRAEEMASGRVQVELRARRLVPLLPAVEVRGSASLGTERPGVDGR